MVPLWRGPTPTGLFLTPDCQLSRRRSSLFLKIPGMTVTREFLAGLPKAELHVHHVGSASPRIVAELAARHPGSPVPADPVALARYFTFTDFAKFIDIYLTVVDLIRTPEDVRLLTYEVARDMAAQNIRYAELTVTPYTSVIRGVAAEAFCEAI